MSTQELDAEIDRNLEAFQKKLPDLLHDCRGKHALMRHAEIVDMYDTLRDAKLAGDKLFDDGLFSVQEITDKPINLGFFSHAVHMGPA